MTNPIKPRTKIGVTITDEAFEILTKRYGHPPTLGDMEEAVQEIWNAYVSVINKEGEIY